MSSSRNTDGDRAAQDAGIETLGNGSERIAIVTLVHGDEVRALDVVERLKAELDNTILSRCTISIVQANREAMKHGKRFVDSDLNRSFPGRLHGNNEERLACQLTSFLQDMDLVLDLHSTAALTEPFYILTRSDPVIMQRLPALRLHKLCIMSPEVASGKALIDHCKGVSIEMHEKDDPCLIAEELLALLRNESHARLEKYEVFDIVREPLQGLVNFRQAMRHGKRFYPVLFGETDYDFVCLAARRTMK